MLRKQYPIGTRRTCFVVFLSLLLTVALAARPAQAQTYTVLHAFADGTDGAIPSPIIRDAQGNLYGTTKYGGLVSCGRDSCGTVYKVDSAGKETVLYSFEGGNNGSDPLQALFETRKATSTARPRATALLAASSVIFKVDPKTGQQTVLYVADGPEPHRSIPLLLWMRMGISTECRRTGVTLVAAMAGAVGRYSNLPLPANSPCSTLLLKRKEDSLREVWFSTPRAIFTALLILAATLTASLSATATLFLAVELYISWIAAESSPYSTLSPEKVTGHSLSV